MLIISVGLGASRNPTQILRDFNEGIEIDDDAGFEDDDDLENG